ncbi:MAG: hypothetical protein JNG89_11390, partial [Planctomycetaceae bacterium]|nr:hypothetical protein [Planctomycetaceae bacterium]
TAFVLMLVNGLCWAAGVEPPEPVTTAELERREEGWKFVEVSSKDNTDSIVRPPPILNPKWYRCTVRVPHAMRRPETTVEVQVPPRCRVWWNSVPLELRSLAPGVVQRVSHPQIHEIAEVNLLVVHSMDPDLMEFSDRPSGFGSPSVRIARGPGDFDHTNVISLTGRWQVRVGDDPSFATLPLPAIYGASPDILFEP